MTLPLLNSRGGRAGANNLLHLCWLVGVTTTRCWTRRGALIAPTKAKRAQSETQTPIHVTPLRAHPSLG